MFEYSVESTNANTSDLYSHYPLFLYRLPSRSSFTTGDFIMLFDMFFIQRFAVDLVPRLWCFIYSSGSQTFSPDPWLMVNPSRGPPALNQVTSSRIQKIIKNVVISTMNVQANLSIIICYILMGQKFQKFKKSKFQYQSLKNIFVNMRLWLPGNSSMAPWGPWPPVWEPLIYSLL